MIEAKDREEMLAEMLALKEKVQYNNFLAALAMCGNLCPPGASRWFNEAVLENFEHTFEDILYYGEEDA